MARSALEPADAGALVPGVRRSETFGRRAGRSHRGTHAVVLGTSPRTTVALSGVVGAGKSSAAKAVVDRLRSAGLSGRVHSFSGLHTTS